MAGLYIDHGWNMGWCLVRRGGGITSGMLNLKHGNPTDGARLLAMTQWLTATLGQLENAGERLEQIAYERITFVGKNDADTLHAHGKQLGNLERWACLKRQPVPLGLAWNVIKKHVTGQGSASRQTMLATVQAAMPEVTDHNQASAVAVMLTATNQKLNTQPKASPRAAQIRKGAGD
jgi:Holliday junction resolvasome RuvABC endonuclease subunit